MRAILDVGQIDDGYTTAPVVVGDQQVVDFERRFAEKLIRALFLQRDDLAQNRSQGGARKLAVIVFQFGRAFVLDELDGLLEILEVQ